MKSLLEFVTPYRRVCGALFLLLISVLGPNLTFAASLGLSHEAALIVRWGLAGLYLLVVLLAAVRNVSERVSWLILLGSGACIALSYGFDTAIKDALAHAAGVFRGVGPWSSAPASASGREFVHPLAGYSLQVPEAWAQEVGPMNGAYQFVVKLDGKTAAILRPSCEVGDQPLALTVLESEERAPDARRICSEWRGLDACLLVRPMRDQAGESWDWFAHGPGSARTIHLEILMYDKRAETDAYAIMQSTKPAPDSFPNTACPVPIEWATPF